MFCSVLNIVTYVCAGINKCPTGAKCNTFQVVFGDAKSFCENVWDHGFKVVPDTEDCFRLWFSADENPNEAVARREAARLLGVSGSAGGIVSSYVIIFLVALYALCL